MTVIALLRGVNVGGHHKIGMDQLKRLFTSLDLMEVRTYIQSGNVIFRTGARDLTALARRIEDAIEGEYGFRADVILRTPDDLRGVISRNPFAGRPGLDPAKLAVTFLASDPGAAARKAVQALKTDPEELFCDGRELYIYFPNGMGRTKLPLVAIGKALGTPGTSRNWRTVAKLLHLSELPAHEPSRTPSRAISGRVRGQVD